MTERRIGRGNEESSRLAKRVISVGFVEPEIFEGNTIYVNLKKHSNGVGAIAVSAANFRYQDPKSLFYAESKTLSNIYSGGRGDMPLIFHPPYDEFIQILATENRATVNCERAKIECQSAELECLRVEFSSILQELQKTFPYQTK